MTVAELITELERYPSEADLYDFGGDPLEITVVWETGFEFIRDSSYDGSKKSQVGRFTT